MKSKFFYTLGLLIVGFVLGWFLKGDCQAGGFGKILGIQPVREGTSQYKFINQLLECEYVEDAQELKSFRGKIETKISSLQSLKKIDEAAVYFRDLNNGPWYGINEKIDFKPASLLKVPVMISYFKRAESDPGLLEHKIKFTGPKSTDEQYIAPSVKLSPGEEYTVDELIRRMIVYSDNEATRLLEEHQPNIASQVFIDLSLLPPMAGLDNQVRVKDYASFFRILYNASYLGQPASNKALELLSQSEFRDGLVAGVPSEIIVSHKFGQWEINGGKQLHDCGIVYYLKHPYMLCIMTRGDNVNDLVSSIKEISALVYQEVDSQLHK